MCGNAPKPTYQGKTYRREAVTLNDQTLGQYGGAWQNGNNGSSLKDNINETAYFQSTRTVTGLGSSTNGLSQISADQYTSLNNQRQTNYNPLTIHNAPKTYKVDQFLKPGVYGADDGSFLMSAAKASTGAYAGGGWASINANKTPSPTQYETWRYVEDAAGTYGAKAFNDKGMPKDFMDLGGHRVTTTSGKTEQVLSKAPEPKKQAEMTDRRQRQTGSVSTSSFRIELGTPAKKSGLRVPV